MCVLAKKESHSLRPHIIGFRTERFFVASRGTIFSTVALGRFL